MKKMDLHIHTIPTCSDSYFDFSLDSLLYYVTEKHLDIIAITNHNTFDKDQYSAIVETIGTSALVLPGIEINMAPNCWHILIIADSDHVADFSERCNKVSSIIKTREDCISISQLKEIFINLKMYLVIPHYDKKPKIDAKQLMELKEEIYCGEVGSIKKFVYCKKSVDDLVPVYFSDFRVTKSVPFPTRQTFLDIGESSFTAVRKGLADKTKVSLSYDNAHELFEVLPGLTISTGLNVVIGGRSSGKSYTLGRIYDEYANIKYIRQFALLETNPEKSEEKFNERIKAKQSTVSSDYLKEFSECVKDVRLISIEEDIRHIEKYLETLKQHAVETERADSYAKCLLFAESDFVISNMEQLKGLISAVETLLTGNLYKEIVESIISRDVLISLHKRLIDQFIREKQISLKQIWVNDVVNGIKVALQRKSAATRVTDVDFYVIQMNRVKQRQFGEVVRALQKEREIHRQDIDDFSIIVKTVPYQGAGELKNHSKSMMSFTEAFKKYGNPYDFLQELKKLVALSDTQFYEYFVGIECKIKNRYGYDVSGGERAEFNLLQEIKDANLYDMLLIDEPESSFDNLFLKDKVNNMIKDIAQNIPVIVVTHNSTVGASISADYIIHTRRNIDEKGVEYTIYTGFPSCRELVNKDGKCIKNIDVTLDCLEAGETAYKERKRDYEILKG